MLVAADNLHASNPSVAQALKDLDLNALTLEKQKLEEILPLAVEYDTNLVLLLLDGHSFSPPTLDEKSGLRRQYPWQVEATCLDMLACAGLKYVLADVLQPEWPPQVALINQLLPS